MENDLSVILNPKLHNKGCFLHYGHWIGERPPSAEQRVRLAIVVALDKILLTLMIFCGSWRSLALRSSMAGGVISFLAPGQEKPARLRASTLGTGFDPADIRDVIAGKRPIPEIPHEAPAPRKVSLVIDTQERLRSGKGPAYERWAKVYNLKQMTAALQYLKGNSIADYSNLLPCQRADINLIELLVLQRGKKLSIRALS